MALVTVERLKEIQTIFHQAWGDGLTPQESCDLFEKVGITEDEVQFYCAWALNQNNCDSPD